MTETDQPTAELPDGTEIRTGDVVDHRDEATGFRRLGTVIDPAYEGDLPGDVRVEYRYDTDYERTPHTETVDATELDHENITIFRGD